MIQKYTPETHPVIAIDMDSTIWTENFPEVGVPYKDSIETINDMVKVGYEVIIWTSRGGDNLEKCKEELYRLGLNKEIKFNEHAKYFTDRYPVHSPKIAASIYIDDKGYGAPKSFVNYWSILHGEFLGSYYFSDVLRKSIEDIRELNDYLDNVENKN